MKKIVILALFLSGMVCFVGNGICAEDNPDLQAVKKAVKENPNYEKGQEVKWFKVLVTEGSSKKAKVKITLPIALVEIFMKSHSGKHLTVHDDDFDLDLKGLFRELKKAGPMALIEISEDDTLVKIWLE